MIKNLLKPKWITLTFILILMILLFARLSEWQFNRDSERKNINQSISNALDDSVIKVEQISALDSLNQWRKVELTGSFINNETLLVRKRFFESRLGYWVITPFTLTNGGKILVNRGWVPVGISSTSTPSIPDITGNNFVISGYLVNIEKFKQTPEDFPRKEILVINPKNFPTLNLFDSFYLQLDKSNQKDIAALKKPELSNGPHFSYAIQWILFALLLPLGWYVLLRNEEN
jgi:cytochrome oxidase assembly protein ShyY1